MALRLLVMQATTSDGRGGSTSVAYAYADGRAYPGTPSVRRDSGFAWTTQTDASPGATTKTRTVTTYNQSPGIEGTAARVEKQALSGASWVTVSAQAHEFHAVAPVGTQGIEFVRDELQTVETHEPNEAGRLVSAQTTRATYDDYGNMLSKVQCAGTLACVTASMTYQIDATNWRPRRLDTTTTSSGGLTLAAAKNVWSGSAAVERREWLDTTNTWRVTTLAYDASGNLASVTSPAAGDGIARVTTTEYDETYRAQPKMTNAGGLVTSSTYYGDGNVWTTTDANDNTVTFTYDVFGRKQTESGPGTRYKEWSYLEYGNPNAQRNREVTWVDASRTLWRDEYFDGVGFKYVVTRSGDCATWVVENVEKDENGRPARTTKPYCYGTTPTWTYTTYDLAGRVSSVAMQSPDRAWHTTTYGYASAAASTTDENGKVTTRYFDARNRNTRVVDAASQTTAYGYDPLGG